LNFKSEHDKLVAVSIFIQDGFSRFSYVNIFLLTREIITKLKFVSRGKIFFYGRHANVLCKPHLKEK
jgi:hypothetical protein